MNVHPSCPLCHASQSDWLCRAHQREYSSCGVCGLVHVHPQYRLTRAHELAHYQLHENDPEDAGYRRFLSRVSEPVLARVPTGALGLDYGSGPGPTLSVMLQEQGLRMRTYDPLFDPQPDALRQLYDFVTCTETAEHFFDPRGEFERLVRLLRPGGLLAVMTEILTPDRDLASWSYARDPTHVCFYRWETFEWLARHVSARLSRPHPNVALLQLQGSPHHTPGPNPAVRTVSLPETGSAEPITEVKHF